jgi:hypothetical protein
MADLRTIRATAKAEESRSMRYNWAENDQESRERAESLDDQAGFSCLVRFYRTKTRCP